MSRKRSPPDLDSPPAPPKQPRLLPYQPLTFMPLVEARASRPIPLVPPPPYSVAMVSSHPVAMATPSDEPDLLSPSQFLSKPPASVTMTTDISSKRTKLIKSHNSKITSLKIKHKSLLAEKFFLENGGKFLEFLSWGVAPNTPRDQYLKQNSIECKDLPPTKDPIQPRPPSKPISAAPIESSGSVEVKKVKQVPPISTSSSTTVQIPLSTVSPGLQKPASFPGLHLPLPTPELKTPTSEIQTPSISSVASPALTKTPSSPHKPVLDTPSPRPATRTQTSFSSVYENSHEDIVHRARHEADVKKAISELRKEGLWSACRLPKVVEPARKKTHWDYLLEEMQWLATDFVNERRWKINAAKKLSRSVARYHSEQELAAARAEKEDQLRLRKIASNIAKEVKFFWDSIAKVVEHKQSILLEEKRKRAMDLHLDYIVDQTTKYSKWLVKGLGAAVDPSLQSTASQDESDDFIAVDQSDNEETIAREEELLKQEGEFDYSSELEALQNEAEMPIEELMESLPQEMLGGGEVPDKGGVPDEGEATMETGDDDYSVGSGSGSEDEATISEQEEHEGQLDHQDEMSMLNKEGELPLEELLAAYNLKRQSLSPQTDVESEGRSRSDSLAEDPGEESDSDDTGLELLVSGKTLKEACQTEAGLSDVAAVAEQFQPKGITLATTEVKTKVPFLLKHTLREYQHIGLDWLVAMHNRRLNGILADEMGLGKTIQTIALLAHLACETGNWGPHLIIVPTSVMLNWELELKKWCPAFKILTYFGSLKERKQKRIGWSKRNAFHVCITSYNIAVTDHRSFKQRKWKYLILDEAQHIKNFKSQRWQTLLNFNSQQRLLLTGTPLQNNLMELWSLMHFLMPAVFSSHSDFREWFSNPLTGMVEGSQEYNASIVKRLHQVLRPFLLHRRKMEVEKQMPQKYEHLVPCSLSKRQRFLYNEYMNRAKTKDTIASGNYLSVINILMQLRKVCNHPDLFEPRPITSPYRMMALEYYTASLVLRVSQEHPFQAVSLDYLNLRLADCELNMEAFQCHRARQLSRSQLDHTHHGHVTDSDEEGTSRASFLEDLHLPKLEAKLEEMVQSNRRHLNEVNNQRCRQQPMYGRDMVGTIRKICSIQRSPPGSNWRWSGHANCLAHQTLTLPWTGWSSRLAALLPSLEEREEKLADIIERFVITVPKVTSPPIIFHTYHPPLSHITQEQLVNEALTKGLPPTTRILHKAATGLSLQFPETRLIQYDCGKLQTLALLLTRLKSEGHRALIFTQMGRVLDVLEIFLNYHGHTYLRLDGSTPVIKRQYLMERFNRDERVFCFILSTRSGGLGVNLTGADTVIFYDSDWNPTMDAQAQDRCHRIGQTRDVHIYRLICTNTVEENILKKANQKKMLGHIAIEGGGFTTDFFKQASIKELFESSPGSSDPMEPSPSSPRDEVSQKQVEEMLMSAEDEGDARAAAKARDEQVAELAEFDEAYNSSTATQELNGAGEKVRSEFAAIDEQLSSVERYAMRYLEEETAGAAAEQLKQAEESIEQAKRDWELNHLKSLRQEEERLAEEEADDTALTYDRPDNSNKVFMDEQSGEEMPIWLPPTPPAEDGDEMYFDLVLDLSYDTGSCISPAILAAIAPFSEEDYDVFGLSRKTLEFDTVKKSQKSSVKHTKEHSNAPPSLFWRRPAVDTLSTKFKKLASHQKKLKSKDQFTPLLEQHPEGPEWMYIEDWILLKSVTVVLEFPLSLTISVPGHTPNWSIVADITSSLSRVRRAPFQCREHLMNVVLPREDHTLKHHDDHDKKMKSRDGSTKKTKARREQRTKSHVMSDGGKEQGRLYSGFFDWILQASAKRKKAPKFTWEASQVQSMHTELLKEYNIQTDSIQSPVQVAMQRADRMQVSRTSFPGAMPGQFKSAADMAKVSSYNMPRPSTAMSTVGKFPSVTTATPSLSPSKIATVSSSVTTPLPSVSTTAPVSKAFTSAAVNISELGKTLIARSTLTPQQLLLLRQSTLQQQQSSLISPTTTQVPQSQAAKTTLQQKIGIDQLRASVGSVVSVALPIGQRLSSITSTSGITSPSLRTGSRPLQTEEVLALLKQQQIRVGQFKAAASKEASSSPSPRSESIKPTKPAPSDKAESPLTTDAGNVKHDMAPATSQKSQTLKLVSSAGTQSRTSTAAMQVTSAQFQQVLALHQAAQAAKNAATSKEQPK